MDQETKKYLDEQFARMATKEDLVGLESRIKDDLGALESRLSKEIADVTEAVGALATHVDERLDEIEPILNRVENHDKRLKYVEDRLTELAR